MDIRIGVPGQKQGITRDKGQSLLLFPSSYTLIDLETTGFDPRWDRIIEVGALRVRDHEVVGSYSHLVSYPGAEANYVPAEITDITGISEQMILDEGRSVKSVIIELHDFIGDDIITGFRVGFDINFVYDALIALNGAKLSNKHVDFWRIARRFYSTERDNRLRDCMHRIGITRKQGHRSLQDCIDTKEVYDYFRTHSDETLLATMAQKTRNLDVTAILPTTGNIDVDNPFFDRYVCFTGKLDQFTRRDAAQLLVNLGAHPLNNVNKTTDFLVLGDTAYSLHGRGTQTTKLKQANQLIKEGQDLAIINETVFLEMISEEQGA